jgi:hypothetical protein
VTSSSLMTSSSSTTTPSILTSSSTTYLYRLFSQIFPTECHFCQLHNFYLRVDFVNCFICNLEQNFTRDNNKIVCLRTRVLLKKF